MYRIYIMDRYLYHGSSKKLDIIEPRESKVIDNEKAVFATNNKALALVFIPKWNDCDFSLGFYDGKLLLMEIYPGAFDILQKASGYLHYVDKKLFVSDKRLGMQQHEFIHKQNVTPLKIERIDNVFESLQNHSINLITFEQSMDALQRGGLLLK